MASKTYYVTKVGGRLNIPLKNTLLHIYEKVEIAEPLTQKYLDEHLGNGLELKAEGAVAVKPVKTLEVGKS